MKTIRRAWRMPFLAEKSKLNRLVTVVRDKLAEVDPSVREHYDVHLSSRKVVETAVFDDVLQLDNSERNQVERVTASLAVYPGGSGEASHTVSIDFDGRLPADVELIVRSENSRWAGDAFALAEEQVERMLQKETMFKLANRRELLPLLMATFGMFLASSVAMVQDSGAPILVRQMWLTPADLADLQARVESPLGVPTDLGTSVLTKQLRNIRDEQGRGNAFMRLVRNWRAWFVALPVLVAVPCFLYLFFRCYPGAVFAWGDAEERYARLVGRRRSVWSIIIGFAVIEVLSNFFGMGLSSMIAK